MRILLIIVALLQSPAARGADISWLAEVQRPPTKLPADAPKLKPLQADDSGRAITTRADWDKRRDAIRKRWRDFLGPIAERRDVPRVKILAEDRAGDVVRQLIEYENEPGDTTQAYLLRPVKLDQKAPGVVVLHSTIDYSIRQPAGLEGPAEKHLALSLAQRGCVTISPRNFLWIETNKLDTKTAMTRHRKRHPKALGMAKMLHDAQVALDILAAREDVDAKRLGTIGHSLGGKEALYLAAFDDRVRATVSSEGGVGTKFSNWHDEWYLGEAIKRPEFTMEHHELVALVTPRAFLLVGGDSADGDRSWPYIDAALPVYRLYEGTPRLGLLNHRQGHAIPPDAQAKSIEWLTVYLNR